MHDRPPHTPPISTSLLHGRIRVSLLLTLCLIGLWGFFRPQASIWWDNQSLITAPLLLAAQQAPHLAESAHLDCLLADGSPDAALAKALLFVQGAWGADWYGLLFGVATMVALLLPGLLFWLISGRMQVYGLSGLLLSAAAVGLALWPVLMQAFTIAYWHPLFVSAATPSVALTAVLAGLCLLYSGRGRWYAWLGILPLVGGALLQPWVAAGWLLLYAIFFVDKRQILPFAVMLVAVVVLCLQAVQLGTGSLSATELAQHLVYANNSFLHLPAAFPYGLADVDWSWGFWGLLIALSVFMVLYAVRRQYVASLRVALGGLLFALGLLLPLYFVAEPASGSPAAWAIVAQPSRLFGLGWWVLCLSVLPLLAAYGGRAVAQLLAAGTLVSLGLWHEHASLNIFVLAAAVWAFYGLRLYEYRRVRPVLGVVLWAAVLLTGVVGMHKHGVNVAYERYLDHRAFYEWADTHIPPQSTVLTYNGLVPPNEIMLVGKRNTVLPPTVLYAPECLAWQSQLYNSVFGEENVKKGLFYQGYSTTDVYRLHSLRNISPVDYVLTGLESRWRLEKPANFLQDTTFAVFAVDSLPKP